MKQSSNNRIFKVVALFFALLLVVSGSAFAIDQWTSLREELSDFQNEEEVVNHFQSKSFEEIITEMNLLDDNLAGDGFIYPAEALFEKAKDISPERILEEIQNEANSDAVRITLIQMNPELGNIEINNSLVPLLEDESISQELKINILLFSSVDVDLYERIALGANEDLAFQALKLLLNVSPERANTIADEIIASISGSINERTRGALMIKGVLLKGSENPEEVHSFIALADGIMATLSNDKTDLETTILIDTLVFAISDTRSKEGITYIVENNTIDPVLKVSAVEQNYNVLISMLSEEASDSETFTVLKAMSLLPLNDLVPYLEESLSFQRSKGTETSQALAFEIERVINFINSEGINANPKNLV